MMIAYFRQLPRSQANAWNGLDGRINGEPPRSIESELSTLLDALEAWSLQTLDEAKANTGPQDAVMQAYLNHSAIKAGIDEPTQT